MKQNYNSFPKIIHIDMDSFYASIELLNYPQYKNKPLSVGGFPSERGVISTASYEARKYGVHSGMSSSQAIKLCPHLIIIHPHHVQYQKISSQIHQIFKNFTPFIEPIALDEAYLDVSHRKEDSVFIAKEIKKQIYKKLHLVASAGVSYNKFLAKIASGYQKPNGLFLIRPEQAISFIENLPIEKFFGIGKSTSKKMHKLNIYKGSDLQKWRLEDLVKIFGKSGIYYYNIVRGIDIRKIEYKRKRKSIGKENSFIFTLSNLKVIYQEFEKLSDNVSLMLKDKNLKGKTITIKVKYENFQSITRSKTLDTYIDSKDKIFKEALELFEKVSLKEEIRLLGISISHFFEKNNTDTLYFPFYR